MTLTFPGSIDDNHALRSKFPHRLPWMPSLYKIVAIIALMLHSTLGCGLHHASACRTRSAELDGRAAANHGPSGCCGEADAEHSVEDDGCCGNDAECPEQEPVSMSDALCGCDHSLPCEDRDGGCHSEVECSFLPTSPCSFSADAVPIAFVSVVQTSHLNGLVTPEVGVITNSACGNSLSRCALLCTWQI